MYILANNITESPSMVLSYLMQAKISETLKHSWVQIPQPPTHTAESEGQQMKQDDAWLDVKTEKNREQLYFAKICFLVLLHSIVIRNVSRKSHVLILAELVL